ncbi:hypothetical protein PROFUN_02839, partial [Planoprotostelium fungivorum]
DLSLGAFIMPNAAIPADTPLQKFATPVEAVELFSGLQFFQKVPRGGLHLCSTINCALPAPNFWEKDKALPPPAPQSPGLPAPSAPVLSLPSVAAKAALPPPPSSPAVPAQNSKPSVSTQQNRPATSNVQVKSPNNINPGLRMQVDHFVQSKARELNFPVSLPEEEQRGLRILAEEKGLECVQPEGQKFLQLRKK